MGNFVCVDWGTSSFRAYLLDNNGSVVDSLNSNDGVSKFKKDELYPFLLGKLDLWLKKYENTKVFLSGMAGSKNGLVETKYISCEASLEDIIQELVKVDDNFYIIPGIKKQTDSYIEILRGEEVQIFGALECLDMKDTLMILPGTHSKWVRIESKKIVDFRTSMSGEVFEAVSNHTILTSSIISRGFEFEVYKRGVDFSKNSGGFLSHIFQVRSRSICEKENNLYSFLSGLLVGSEIKEMMQIFDAKNVIVVGNSNLNSIYKTALSRYGIKSFGFDAAKATQKAIYFIYRKVACQK